MDRGVEKFNTCKYRSETQEEYTIRTCCQYKQVRGWVCHKLGIQNLTHIHCLNCQVYSPKEDVQKI